MMSKCIYIIYIETHDHSNKENTYYVKLYITPYPTVYHLLLHDTLHIHAAGAVIFFVFEDIMSILLMVDFIGTISTCSMWIKLSSSTVACASTAVRCIHTQPKLSNPIIYICIL